MIELEEQKIAILQKAQDNEKNLKIQTLNFY